MKHIVLGDRVLVEIKKPEEKTASGIIVGPAPKTERQMGTVVGVGSGPNVQKADLKAGDSILFRKMAGQTYEIDGRELVSIDGDDIILKYHA